MEFNTMTLKQINTHKLKEALRALDIATKNKLASLTGLSVATCGNILTDLIETKEVFEVELGESTGGRPSRQFKYNQNYSQIACIYFQIDHAIYILRYSVYDLQGNILDSGQKTYPLITYQDVHKTINKLSFIFPNITIISFGIPGVIHDNHLDICDIDAFKNLSIEDLAPSDKYIVIGNNDVNAMIYGYYKEGNYSIADSLSYLYYPDNGCPGSAMLFAGKVILGHSHFAGEVSYLPMQMTRQSLSEALNIARTISCINCIINPKTVILSGPNFNAKIIQNIKKELIKITPNTHFPEIIYQPDNHINYMNGLLAVALEQLGIGVSFINEQRKDYLL